MATFVPVDDALLAERIAAANDRVVFVSPAVSSIVAEALGACFRKAGAVSVTIILDPDEEPYRLGYGDLKGLAKLQQLAIDNHIGLRSQPGLRVGLLLADNSVLMWSPTPTSVDAPRESDQPNGLDLGSNEALAPANPSGASGRAAPVDAAASLSERLRCALGADDSDVLIDKAEIGRHPFTPEQVAATKKALDDNPPAPVDLARKTRVFSTRYQFVEHELRGAAWTQREIKLSSILLNSDVPKELQPVLETRFKPYSGAADVAIEVPAVVSGRLAFDQDGKPILAPMTQSDLHEAWRKIRGRYLRKLKGFGWLIERSKKEVFERDVAAFEGVLETWVQGFRIAVCNDDEALSAQIVDLIVARARRSTASSNPTRSDIEDMVRAGIQRLRVTEPGVKRVFKDIAWESTRDAEFTKALRKALPEVAREPWFEIFTAVRQRSSVAQ
jgi:hypothetical protein